MKKLLALVFVISGIPVILTIVFLVLTLINTTGKTLPGKIINLVRQDESENNLRFILLGDTGSGATIQYKVASAIENHCEEKGDCKAVFILGDIIYENGVASVEDEQFQTKFELPYKDIDLPFYIALGNHDYRGCTDCYMQYSEISEKWNFSDYYYTQTFDETVTFFIIDTESFDIDQQDWLDSELNTSKTKYNIVLGHRHIVSNENTKKDEDWKGRYELSDIVCHQADYYISGHAHLLEYSGVLEGCKTKLITSGSGGSYVRKISDSFKGEFYAEENGFLSLSIQNNKIFFNLIDKSGDELFNSELTI